MPADMGPSLRYVYLHERLSRRMDVGDRPWVVQSTAYLRENAWLLTADLVVMAGWMVFGSEALRALMLPTWLQHVVLFLGVVIYVNMTPQWKRPGATDGGDRGPGTERR